MRNTNKKGFTIVELVIVVAVIAILAAVLIPTFSSIIKKANESNDISAVRQMNVFLASAKITGDIKSPLDVFDIFEESGFDVEDYKPLYNGRTFYYDVQKNCVVYVDDATGKILAPAEYEGETKGSNDWMTLSLSLGITEADKPASFKIEGSEMSATVANGREYAYVIEQYNSAAEGISLNITVNGTVDLSGATIAISETKGAVTITGTNNAVIKNVASNKFFSTSTTNTSGIAANYQAAALVAKANHKVTISNISFENLNVRVPDAGNVALLCGGCGSGGSLEIENVSIKNSTVIGGRSVAALVGATAGGSGPIAVNVKGTLKLENVNVGTTQGRSALLVVTNIEKAMNIASDATISISNSFCKMYEDSRFEQTTSTTVPASHKIVDADGNDAADYVITAWKTLDKTEKTNYAHKDNALVLQYCGSTTREAIMTVDALYDEYK